MSNEEVFAQDQDVKMVVRICHDEQSDILEHPILTDEQDHLFFLHNSQYYYGGHAPGLRGIIGSALCLVDTRIGGYAEVEVNGIVEFRHPAITGFDRITLARKTAKRR